MENKSQLRASIKAIELVNKNEKLKFEFKLKIKINFNDCSILE